VEARLFEECAASTIAELVTILGMDRFASLELKRKIGGFNPNLLASHAFEVHFNARILLIPQSKMLKPSTIKVCAEVPVQPVKQVQIERGGYSLRIVVSG
jgi:hypothetical protein